MLARRQRGLPARSRILGLYGQQWHKLWQSRMDRVPVAGPDSGCLGCGLPCDVKCLSAVAHRVVMEVET